MGLRRDHEKELEQLWGVEKAFSKHEMVIHSG